MWQHNKHSPVNKNQEQLSGFVFQIFLQTRRSPESCKVDGQETNTTSEVELQDSTLAIPLMSCHICWHLLWKLNLNHCKLRLRNRTTHGCSIPLFGARLVIHFVDCTEATFTLLVCLLSPKLYSNVQGNFEDMRNHIHMYII